MAWRSSGWIYDVLGEGVDACSAWRPDYRRIGDAYAGTPPYKAVIHAATIPAWQPAIVLAPLAWILLAGAMRERRRARMGRCAACGYPLAGLALGAPCPECGGPTKASVTTATRPGR